MLLTNTDNIKNISLDKIIPFREHPFIVEDDEQMCILIESIREVGVLNPIVVRPMSNGMYELISGHRRMRACKMAGMKDIPAVIFDMDHETATVAMVDSNFHREKILPSEKAKAYKMKLDAIKALREKNDISNVQAVSQWKKRASRDIVAENTTECSRNVQRYIRLNELIPQLLEMVDLGKIAMTSAVEISFLTKEEQEILLLTIESEQTIPSLSQALRMKNLSREGKLTDDDILMIMIEQKKPEAWNLSIPIEKVAKYFPKSYTPKKIEESIYKILEAWKSRNL